MTAPVPIPGSVGVKNPMLDLFRVPPTDISYVSYRMVPISPFTTGINPVDFQIDPQEDFVDLSRSYFEIQWNVKKSDGNDTANTDKTYFVNNLAHSLFKQISVRLNGTLISPQTDTYAYKAYLETLLNYNRDDGETILAPQCWNNIIDIPDALTANQQTQTHDDFKALDEEQQLVVKTFQKKVEEFSGDIVKVFSFVPHIEVFHLSKLLIPGVQTGIKMYFNSPDFWSMRYTGAVALRLQEADIKLKLYLCQVKVNDDVYRELMSTVESGRQMVTYPTVRSEIRTYNILDGTRHVEINNPFHNRLPNMVVVGLVESAAFNGDIGKYPFSFKTFNLSSIQQLVRGESYPYETLELVYNSTSTDHRGYRQFLQATGCLCKSRGNMVRGKDWGKGKHCTLFVYENAANGCLNSPILNPQLSGEIRLVLDFAANQGDNVTAIIYGEFENKLEIDNNKTVLYDVYRT